jgi:hypothetical protein
VTREAFEALARELGWSLYRAGGPDILEPYTATWRVEGQDVSVQYTEDDLLGARYVMISGSRVEDASAALEDRLETVTLDAAVEGFASAPTVERRGESLVRAVIAADPDVVQPAVLAVIRDALSDPAPDLRRTAIATCTYLTWNDLDPLLAEVTRQDPEPDVVGFASEAMALRRHSHGGSR